MPPRSSRASFSASIVSFLVLPPWIAFRYSAWPSTKGMPSAGAQIGEPVPGEQALAADDQAVAVGRQRGQEVVGFRRQRRLRARSRRLASSDAERHGPGVQIDAAVESVLSGVESHHGLLGVGGA